MKKIDMDKIKEMVINNKLRCREHIMIRLLQRNIMQEDVENTILNGEIIEEYENDYPYPSCLIYGINLKNKVIHVVCGSNGEELWLITAYYPDNIEWEQDLKTRRGIK